MQPEYAGLAVAILSNEPITGDGARAYLRSQPELRVLDPEELALADVLLVVVDDLSEDVLALMEQAAQQAPGHRLRMVVVTNTIREHQLLRAVGCGLISVIPRNEASYEAIVRVLLDSQRGQAVLPSIAIGWLIEHTRLIQQDVLAPMGLTAAGLQPREVDVLRLLAEGLSTNEIATKLNYSERTIKTIIHSMMTRLGLRNRPHAVAYAMRVGAL
jgi:DNA-binding NarL/FixJ family response regulator